VSKKEETKRRRIDWEAIERDYRTGKFTLRELEVKYETDNATISRRMTADRKADPSRWQKDLTKVVRQATSAKLMAEVVSSEVSKGQQDVSNVVQAAAELNTSVILRHREDIKATRTLAMAMLGELSEVTHSPERLAALFEAVKGEMDEGELFNAKMAMNALLKLPTRVGSIQKLADTITKVQVLERKAFGLDEEGGDDPDDTANLTDDQLMARIKELSGRVGAG
jgi:hypothetical protein